jgi:prepilin signal peptidase PulO-like enzyme (type II secretory pathway)
MLSALMILFGAFAGGATGSFLACARWRVPRGIPLSGRSFCDNCEEAIPAYHNLPVISWLILGGRSRCCGARIPLGLLVYELVCAALGALIVEGPLLIFGPTSQVLLAGPLSLLGLGIIAMGGSLLAARFYASKRTRS